MDNDNKVIIEDALGDGIQILSGLRYNIATLEKSKRLTSVERRYLVIAQMVDIISEKENYKLFLDLTDLTSVKEDNAQIRDNILNVTEKDDITDSEITSIENSCTKLEQKLGIDNQLTIRQDKNYFSDRTTAINSICGAYYEEIPLDVCRKLGDIFNAEQRELASLDAKIAEANNYLSLLNCMPNFRSKSNDFRKGPNTNPEFWSNRIVPEGTQKDSVESRNTGLADKDQERRL